MPTPTYTPLANVTLGSAAANVTFSSINQTYRDLIVVINSGNSANIYNGIYARFNSDTGNNYSGLYALGNGSTTLSGTHPTNLITFGAGGASTSATIVNIMDYSATDKHKTVLVKRGVSDATGYSVGMEVGRWANTAAITSMIIFDQSGYTFDAGSNFSLYGIVA